MSHRAPYPHGSPSLPSTSVFGATPDIALLDPESPSKRPKGILRQSSQGTDASAQRKQAAPSSPSRSKKDDDLPHNGATGGRAQPSIWRPRRLTAIIGRRRRWQRLALVGLFILALYLLIRPRPSASGAPKPTSKALASGQSRRKIKPLHVRTTSPNRAPVPPSVVLQSRSEHTVRDGLLEVDMSSKIHPLYQLIRDEREEWDEKVASQSATLKEAVEEYQRRNVGRMPPKGFDKWWAYVVENKVPLPDEYDQINRDLLPYRALSPAQLQQRLETASKMRDSYTIRVKSGSIRTSVTFDDDEGHIEGARMRVEGQVDLLKPVAKDIPDFTAVYTVHDTAAGTISWGHRMELEELVEDGQYLDEEEEFDLTLRGFPAACPSLSKIRAVEAGLYFSPPNKTFISSHRSAMDLCAHPDQIPLHGLLAGKSPHHTPLTPLFCLSKTKLHSDILGVPTEQWSEYVPDVPWEEKTQTKLLWRGSNTGSLFSASTPWRESHRIRLIQLARESEGAREMLPLPKKANGKSSAPTLGDGTWEMEKWMGNRHYLDFEFTGGAIHGTCGELEKSFNFVDRMTHDDALHYKYVVDVDGNAWSARFQRLLASGSLIFKVTITPEWWTDRIQPWVHYVPIQVDYSDLHDAFAFFEGGIDGQDGEPLLAKQIATEGKEWVNTHWRKEDMTAYVFRLYLEWARLLAPSKHGADFVYDESMERSRFE